MLVNSTFRKSSLRVHSGDPLQYNHFIPHKLCTIKKRRKKSYIVSMQTKPEYYHRKANPSAIIQKHTAGLQTIELNAIMPNISDGFLKMFKLINIFRYVENVLFMNGLRCKKHFFLTLRTFYKKNTISVCIQYILFSITCYSFVFFFFF